METPPVPLEARLQTRYHTLVAQHSTPASALASGLRALPNGGQAFAATQAAWRFFANPKVTLPALCHPLQAHVRQQVRSRGLEYVLILHDWSWLDYNTHTRKTDRKCHSHGQALGYELLSALAVSSRTGAPLGPVCVALQSAEGVYTGEQADCQPAWESHPDALWAHIEAARKTCLCPRPVCIS